MDVREERLAVLLGRVLAKLLLERAECGERVVALDAPPVVKSFDGDAGKVFTLRVDSSHCRQVQGRRGRGGGSCGSSEAAHGACRHASVTSCR